jgi:hypothetical protein
VLSVGTLAVMDAVRRVSNGDREGASFSSGLRAAAQ